METTDSRSTEIKGMFQQFTSTATLGELFKLGNKGNNHSLGNNILKYWQAHAFKLTNFQNVTKGASQWRNEGIWIAKGSKAMYIWAPCTFKKTEKNDKGEDVEKRATFFKLVPVFDISQTNGWEKYQADMKKKDAMVYRRGFPTIDAEKMAGILGCTLKKIESQVGAAQGSFTPSSKEITYDEGSTLLHEVGHAVTYNEKNSYAMNELLAEIFCLAVYNRYGMEFNYNYSNIWNSRLKDNEMTYGDFTALYTSISKKADELLEQIK